MNLRSELSREVDEFDRVYRRLAIAFGEAEDAGHEREAYDIRHRLIRMLYYHPVPGLPEKKPCVRLLEDPNPWVRFWALGMARQFLPGGTSTAIRRELSRLPGKAGSSAAASLAKPDRFDADIDPPRPPRHGRLRRYPAPLARLLPRELQVLRLWCAAGGNSAAVAEQLGLHQTIVEKHLNAICDQFRVEDLPELEALACRELT